ncbi:MAG: hypothetical protein ACR2RF_09610 [Geminicoccaceae bacterium]
MANYDTKKCTPVAQGGVGESGASTLLVHQFNEKIRKKVVLQTVETSLCPNTGAIGVLVVNGESKAHGNLTANGSSIETEVGPGETVIAIVHTIPLFNEIACVRLGELTVELLDCGPA